MHLSDYWVTRWLWSAVITWGRGPGQCVEPVAAQWDPYSLHGGTTGLQGEWQICVVSMEILQVFKVSVNGPLNGGVLYCWMSCMGNLALVLGIGGRSKIDHQLHQSDRWSIIFGCGTPYYYLLIYPFHSISFLRT